MLTLGKGVVPTGTMIGNRNLLETLSKERPPPPSVCMCVDDAARNNINRVINSEEFSRELRKKFPSLGNVKLRRCRDGRGVGVFAVGDVTFDEENKVGEVLSLYIGSSFELTGDEEFHKKLQSDRACATDGGKKCDIGKNGIDLGVVNDIISKKHSDLLEFHFNMHIYGFAKPFGFDPNTTPGKLRALGVGESTIDYLSGEMLPPPAFAGGFLNHACGSPNCRFEYLYVLIGAFLIHLIVIVNIMAVSSNIELTLQYGDSLVDESLFHSLPEHVRNEILAKSKGRDDSYEILKRNGILDFVDGY